MNEKSCPSPRPERVAREERPRRPRVDLLGTEREVRLRANMPGTDEGSVELTLEDGILILRGTPSLAEPDGLESCWTEFELGPYERRFALGDGLSREGIRATVKDGVVEVVVPKVVEERRTIPITVR